MKKKRVGLVGVGKHAIGRIMPAIEKVDGVELFAVLSRGGFKNAALADSIAVFEKTDDLIDADLDVVYLSSPTSLHYPQAREFLRNGIEVWSEKPLATTPGQAEDLLQMAAANRTPFLEAFMFAYHEQATILSDLVRSQPIGRIRLIDIKFHFPHLDSTNFRYDDTLGGGAFLDHACYLTKMLQILFDTEWELLGGRMTRDEGYKVDTSGVALLESNKGFVANLQWGFGFDYANEMRITGDQGQIFVDSPFTKPASRGCSIELSTPDERRSIPIDLGDPYADMISTFAAMNESQKKAEMYRFESHSALFFDIQHKLMATLR